MTPFQIFYEKNRANFLLHLKINYSIHFNNLFIIKKLYFKMLFNWHLQNFQFIILVIFLYFYNILYFQKNRVIRAKKKNWLVERTSEGKPVKHAIRSSNLSLCHFECPLILQWHFKLQLNIIRCNYNDFICKSDHCQSAYLRQSVLVQIKYIANVNPALSY